MNSIGTEVGQKMRSAIKAKLMELGCYVDDELPDYIMVMVANKRSRSQMIDDLQLFLRSDTEIFVEWLQQVLKKLKEVTITNPDVCGSFRELKRKAAMEIAQCVIKKEKKDKKIKSEKKTRNVELFSEEKSITDEIPVQAIKLVEKRNQAIRSHEKRNRESIGETSKDSAESTKLNEVVNEDNFDIPSLAEVNELEDSQLDIVANRIKEARNRIVLMKSDSEDDDFINLRADAEELMGDDIDGTNSTNTESLPINERRIITLSKEDSEIPSGSKKSNLKPSLSERLGARPENSSKQSSKTDEKVTRIGLSKSIREEQQLASKIRSRVQSIVKKPVENKSRKKEISHISVHKRLGFPSSVVSFPKRNEDEELQPKSMMSVVQVKLRKNVSGKCQANKNLLLKAVAEAQKSVTQTPRVGKEVKEKPEEKDVSYLLKNRRQKKLVNNNKILTYNTKKSNKDEEDSKVQNIIIEVRKSKKAQSDSNDSEPEENNDKYLPTSMDKNSDSSLEENDHLPSGIDLTFNEEDLDFDEDDVENVEESEKEVKTNHQFIVTLDGLKDKNLLKNTEKEIEKSSKLVKKPPSPIVFDKKEVPKVEKTAPKIPEKLPKVHLPLSVKTKERCKYWPNCRLKEACEYVHPNTTCNLFPLCKFGDKCLYIHPKCKFDASCTRKDCPYSHGNIKVPIKTVGRPVVPYVMSQEVCKYHPNCSNPHCHFYHPVKPCRFGKYCMNKSECSFSHGKIPTKNKLTWHSNAR